MSESAERLFERARALPRAARATFLREALPGDPSLRAELLALLDSAAAAEEFFGRLGEAVLSDSFWSDPPSCPGRREGGEAGGTQAVTDGVDPLPGGLALGNFRIVERIANGGMGTVYRAFDTRLGRHVALKFLSEERPAGQEAGDRLLAEARAAAVLEHPNICTVYEVGETETGRLYIAMALHPGETLRERLARGPLPLEEAADVAVQLARGLSAAHQRGIVHGDVKPGNIMLTPDGTVKLLDFGLAETSAAVRVGTGSRMGTVPYMAPERVLGQVPDPRSDLWALGVVLHEMLTGRSPFPTAGHAVLVRAIVQDGAMPATSLPAAAAPLLPIVERLLRKEPEARYATAEEVRVDLQRAVSSVRSVGSAPRGDRHRVGMTVIGLAVGMAAVAALAHRGAGGGERAPSVMARLRTTFPAATSPLVGPDLDEAGAASSAGGVQESLRRRTRSVAAYELYVRSSDRSRFRSDSGVLQGVEYLRQAIALDSTYAAAHAGLALMYVVLSGRDDPGTPASELRSLAARSASRAVALEDSLAEAHAVLGLVRLYADLDPVSARRELERSIALDPGSSLFREWLAQVLILTGRPREALRMAERAVASDSLSPTARAELAHALLANGREDEALAQLEPIAALRPPLLRAAVYLAEARAGKGQWMEAADALRGQAVGGDSGSLGLYAYVLGRAGRTEEALRVTRDLLGRWSGGRGSSFAVGLAYAGLGQVDRAIPWLEAAVEDRSALRPNINIMSPIFADLRSDPRLRSLQRRLGLGAS